MKNLNIMSKLLGGLMVLGSLAACSVNDNEAAPSVVPTGVMVDYKATVSQQLLDVATVIVRYIDENGHTAVEHMTATTWTKSVIIALPGKAGLNIVPTMKSGVSEGEYVLEAKGEMTYNWLSGNKLIWKGSTVSTPPMEGVFYAGNIGAYTSAIASKCQVARSFTDEYTVNTATITIGTNGDDSTQNTGISDEGATDNGR